MPKIKVSVSHQLGQDEARTRISKLLADSRAKFGGQISNVREQWTDNVDVFHFSAMGFDIDGQLNVQPAEVAIELNLPWAALPFKSRVESEIVKHARDLLG
jgi:hypothetical protein